MISLAIDERGVARLTVDNQRKLNVIGSALLDDFTRQIKILAGDDTLRALVVTGAGTKAFIGGADINEMARLIESTARPYITRLHRACEALRNLPFPVIARISGYALGAGLEIAAACDLRIASTTARFGMPEVKVGIPSVIEAALLPPLIGWGRTRRLLLAGEIHTAREAERWGLVDVLAAPKSLDKAVERTVESILKAGPNAIRIQKKLIRAWEDLPLSGAIDAGIDAFAESYATDEPRRMMRIFLTRPRPSKRW
jgi:enoyl-CoA hydratase/carnithine racemase